jgi:hypothetical protein
MYLAQTGLFRARWTNDIHEEWIRSVLREFPDLTREKMERVRDLMNSAVRDCLVDDYQRLVPSLTLPDPDDRHVLAAAIQCKANVVLTLNTRDFPATFLAPLGIEALPPDEWIMRLIALDPEGVYGAFRTQRASLKKPPMSPEQFLGVPSFAALPRTLEHMRTVLERI